MRNSSWDGRPLLPASMCHDVVVFKPHNERSRPPRRLPPSVWVSQNTGSKSTASMPFGCCSTGTQPRRAAAIQPASAPRGAAFGHRTGQHHHRRRVIPPGSAHRRPLVPSRLCLPAPLEAPQGSGPAPRLRQARIRKASFFLSTLQSAQPGPNRSFDPAREIKAQQRPGFPDWTFRDLDRRPARRF